MTQNKRTSSPIFFPKFLMDLQLVERNKDLEEEEEREEEQEEERLRKSVNIK